MTKIDCYIIYLLSWLDWKLAYAMEVKMKFISVNYLFICDLKNILTISIIRVFIYFIYLLIKQDKNCRLLKYQNSNSSEFKISVQRRFFLCQYLVLFSFFNQKKISSIKKIFHFQIYFQISVQRQSPPFPPRPSKFLRRFHPKIFLNRLLPSESPLLLTRHRRTNRKTKKKSKKRSKNVRTGSSLRTEWRSNLSVKICGKNFTNSGRRWSSQKPEGKQSVSITNEIIWNSKYLGIY